MKFLLALLIASQAFLLINAQATREQHWGDLVTSGSRLTIFVNETFTGQPGLLTSGRQNYTSDAEIRTIRVSNIGPGPQGIATIGANDGGIGHREVSIFFATTIQGQTLMFRVEIFTGEGAVAKAYMANASVLFLCIAFLFSYLLK